MTPTFESGVPPEAMRTVTLPAEQDRLGYLLDLVHEELELHDCPIGVQYKLDIAIEELFVNVCSYAYEGMAEQGACRVDYAYSADPHTLTLTMIDWGVPFDPFAREDPVVPTSVEDAPVGGLGILMVKRMCDWVGYLRDGDKNVVTIKKSW